MKAKTSSWTKAIVCGAVSAVAMLSTYLSQPEDPEYAGSGFSWALTHFLPLALVSFIAGSFAAFFYVRSVSFKENWALFSLATPVLLLSPLSYILVRLVMLFTRHS